MTRVHFASQLAAPPGDRIRMDIAYPRVAQDNTVHDRIVSKDLHWGKRPLSSTAVDDRQENETGLSIVESLTDSGDEVAISPADPMRPSATKDSIVKLVVSPSKNLASLMKQRIYTLDTQTPPSHLPPLSTPCSSNDSSSQSSDSSGRSTPSSGFLEDHMQKREDELMSSTCSGLFSVVEVTNPQGASRC